MDKQTLAVDARLTFNKVQFDKDTEAHLVVSLKAPKIDWQAKRPRVCVIPVIDVSPSMEQPPTKIQYAKQSVMKLIDHLQPGDFCGVVAFGGSVEVVAKPREVTQAFKDELKAKVGNLRTHSATNFSGGLCEGLELLNKSDLPGGMLLRAVMFTDGLPNTGVAITKPDILKLLEANLGIATVSAFGYGTDADQELLADVAKTGKGNFAFIRNPEDALSAFAKELGGLLSTYAQNITIEVAPHNGHTVVETVSDVEAKEDGNKVKVTLSDILSEEERHLTFKVKLDKQPNAFPRQSSVFDVNVSYDALDEGQTKRTLTEEVKVKVQFVKEEEADTKPVPEVDRIVGLAQLVEAQIQAEELAKAGNYSGAVNVMRVTCDSYQSRGLDDLVGVANKMGQKMSSHHVYAQNSGYLASSKAVGTRSVGTSGADAEASMDFMSVGVNLSTSAQADMQKQWGNGVVAHGDPSAIPGQGITGFGGGGMPNVVVSPSIIIQQPGAPSFVPNVKVVKPTPKSKVSKSKSKRW